MGLPMTRPRLASTLSPSHLHQPYARRLRWTACLLALLGGAPAACGGGDPDDSDGTGGQAGGQGADESGGASSGGSDGTGGSDPAGGSGGNGSGGSETGGQGGEGGSANTPTCEEEQERTVPCASGADGAVQAQVCVDEAWQDDGACTCEGANDEYDPVAEACVEAIACDPEASPFGGGEGTEESPFAVCSVPQLQAVRTELDAHFILASSLDLSELEDFEPIGDALTPFVGVFDGGGRALEGLVVSAPEFGDVGLFGVVGDSGQPAILRDLVLRDFELEGLNQVGVLAAHLQDDETLVELVNVEGGSVQADFLVGGVVGNSEGIITGCSASASVTATAAFEYFGSAAGGLLGQNLGGSVVDSTASGDVTGLYAVGGLVGVLSLGSISDGMVSGGLASGTVTAVSNAGGLVGLSFGAVEASCASGAVDAEGYVGGLVGVNLGTILTSCATGPVEGNAQGAGGLVGNAGNASSVTDSYATGSVRGATMVGGLLGSSGDANDVTRCYATGSVTADDLVGGLIGEVGDTVATGSYFIDSSFDNGPGEPLTSSEFAVEASFNGWDFDDIWVMDATLGRPVLR